MTDDLPFRLPPVNPDDAPVPASTLSPELLASQLVDGEDELAAWVLRHALVESARADVYDGLVRDAMRLVGDNWRNGRWTIAEEHLASRTLLRTLERVRPEMGPEGRIGPLAILAGVAGEEHMIGLVCLEQVLVEAGWTVANLGADMPSADLAAYVSRHEPALVALSASDTDRVGVLAATVSAVRAAAADRKLPVVVGGMITGVPGIGTTVQADATIHNLGEALAFAEAHRPSD